MAEDAAVYGGFTAMLRHQLRTKFEAFLQTADANQMVALEKVIEEVRKS